MPYQSTKTFGHEIGLSCCFRQWRAESHCSLLHGYALSIKLTFETYFLDDRNWVVDFGGLKELRKSIEGVFDHKTVIAADDPKLAIFQSLADENVLSLVVMPGVGCEAFAQYIFQLTSLWLAQSGMSPRVRIAEVEVREHGANSAIYRE